MPGQAGLGAARCVIGDGPLGIIGLVTVGQVDHLLGVMALVGLGDHEPVGDDVVDIGRPHGAGIGEVVDLDRRRAVGQDAGPAILGEALAVDGDIDLELTQQKGDIAVAFKARVDEPVEGLRTSRG